MKVIITSSGPLKGEINIPGDKSISHRGVMLGAISRGTTRLTNFLMGEDCLNTINAFRSMGVQIEIQEDNTVLIKGNGLKGLKQPETKIDAGNSGTTTRLLLGILAGQKFTSVIDGDPSLRKRPMRRVTVPLSQMGAIISGAKGGEYLPLTIEGSNLKGIEYSLPVASAQVKSAIILATLFADSESKIIEPAKSRDHTELMLQHFGGSINVDGNNITVRPVDELYAQSFRVPGDISSAAYFITAALLIEGSEITMKNVGLNPTRTGIIDVYKRMGAKIQISNTRLEGNEPVGDITAAYSNLKGITLGGGTIPRLIDELPIIALAATQASGTTVIKDAEELKVKESNRIDTVVNGLKTLGANIEATDDGMIIRGPTNLSDGSIESHMDHRIAMMGAIAGLVSKGQTTLNGGEWIDISYPGFFKVIENLQK